VVAHRLVGEREPAGHGEVVQTTGDEVEHLALALGELRERRGGATGAGDEPQHPLRHPGRDEHVPCRDRPHGPLHVGRRRALEQVAARARPHRGEHGVVVLQHGHHEDAQLRAFTQHRVRRIDAGRAGEVQIHDHHVGGHAAGELDGLRGVGGLAHHREPGDGGQQRVHAQPERRVVVDDEDAQRRAHVTPPSTVTS
jgi:hypothetical protein